MNSKSLLIVDDDEVMRKLIREYFEKNHIKSYIAASGEDAIRFFKQKPTPIIISDIRMIGMSGLNLLREIKSQSPETIIILMTAFGNLDDAIDAIQLGAFDYISKPFKMGDLLKTVERAFQFLEDQKTGSPQTEESYRNYSLTGRSQKIVEVYKQVARASFTRSTVLIIGEKGIGKKQVARSIYDHSPNREKPFILISLQDGLLSLPTLEAGATVYIEQIHDLKSNEQLKLLDWLESESAKDYRLIVSTQVPLSPLVKKGKFREDLYLRLNIVSIQMPSLRERPEDIAELSDFFLKKINPKSGSQLAPDALAKLKNHSWPGNIRELETTLERSVAYAAPSFQSGKTLILHADDIRLDESHTSSDEASVSPDSLELLEKQHILKVLKECDHNKTKAAEKLGIDRTTLYRKAQKFGIKL